jgi:hypothetical protein
MKQAQNRYRIYGVSLLALGYFTGFTIFVYIGLFFSWLGFDFLSESL